MKNSSVVELFIFIVFVGFVGFMMNSEMELENNNLLTNGEKNNFERTVEWENRLNRMSFVGTVVHDSDPRLIPLKLYLLQILKMQITINYLISREHLKSWDNVDNRSRIDNSISFKPDNTSNKVECNVGAGVHEFQVTVTDTYNEKSTEIITVSIGNEENIGPNGSISVVKRIPDAWMIKLQTIIYEQIQMMIHANILHLHLQKILLMAMSIKLENSDKKWIRG